MKITFIVPWFFGPLPKWIDQFVQNCNQVKGGYHWLIFSDRNENRGNVKFIRMTKEEFRQRTIEEIGCPFPLDTQDKRKTCNFRPAFGELFDDFLGDSEFWGYCDLDVVFGRVNRFLTPQILNIFDVYASDIWNMCGPLSLLRNNQVTNRLWRRDGAYPDGESIYTKLKRGLPQHYRGMEEHPFGKIVWEAHLNGDIQALFAFRHSHDRENSAVEQRSDGALYDRVKQREVIIFHFPGKKTWPFGERK